jgi:DNA-binding transcriptional MerR regulator
VDDTAYTIRQAASQTGVSSKTLRHWEKIGLIPRPRRTHSNYRLYTQTDLDRILFILKAKSLGFTLSEIRHVLELARSRTAPCESVIRWVGEKVTRMEDQISALREMQGRLKKYLSQWGKAGPVRRLGPNEICRCIASVSADEIKLTADPLSRHGRGRRKGV